MDNDNKVVLVVDEAGATHTIRAVLKNRGIEMVVLDPTEDFTRPTSQYALRAVIYEPFYVMFGGKPFRPIVDEILERAKANGAIRIACSTQPERTLTDQGFIQGTHYDRYVEKVASSAEILEGIL